MKKLVLFDLDGTLLDTSEGVLESVKYVCKALECRELTVNELKSFIGPPIQQSLINHFNFSEEKAQEGADIFRDYYKNKALFKAKPYIGMMELLDELKSYGIKIGVATFKREDYAIDLLKYFDIDKFCISMHGADNSNRLTKADIIKKCICEVGVSKDEVVYIGDTEGDRKASIECGIDFIGVSYGFGYKNNEVYDFDCVDEPKSVLNFLG